MKITFINLYSGSNNRGAESFTHELAERLAPSHVVKFYSAAPVKSFQRVKNIEIKSKTVPPSEILPANSIRALFKLLFLDPPAISVLVFSLKVLPKIIRDKPDIIVPMNGFWQVVMCKIVQIVTGSKILITGHSGPGWDEKWNLYLKPDVFVATTGPTGEWAKKNCSWTKIVLIPYGVDINKFMNARYVKLNLEKPIVLCPAAAVEYKQVPLAIEAVSAMEKGSLVHLGAGPERDKISDLGLKKLGSRRFLTKQVSTEEMPAYYQAADIVTLPSSFQENSPMVFLEAMATGKFVVTTDAPRPRWILGPAGRYIDPQDTQQYSQILSDSARIKDNTDVKKQAEKFSWDKIIVEYEKLINEL